uniref:Uncharacterized protein n=1 Tax=Anguilla anguilla TaxID=7936 RepID=A0A0E9PP10_ANGAN
MFPHQTVPQAHALGIGHMVVYLVVAYSYSTAGSLIYA